MLKPRTNFAVALLAEPMGMFPTMGSLEEVMDYAVAKIQVTNKNDLAAILFIYHNTLLKVIDENHQTR